ncbi:MAG: hypothetical protein M1530_02170 [Candidatus Marsarchaeota archaeon]|nr:hypothetical protein [Candidatus Marsarchaeota archaeon]
MKTVPFEIDPTLQKLETSLNYVQSSLESGMGSLKKRISILLQHAQKAGEKAIEPVLDFFSQLSVSQKESFMSVLPSLWSKPDSPALRKLVSLAIQDGSNSVREGAAEMVFGLKMKNDYNRAAQTILDVAFDAQEYPVTDGNWTISYNAVLITDLPMLFAQRIGNKETPLDYRLYIANTMIDSMSECPDIREQAIYFVKNENLPYEVRHELVGGFSRTRDLDALATLKRARIKDPELAEAIASELRKQMAIKKMDAAKTERTGSAVPSPKRVVAKN